MNTILCEKGKIITTPRQVYEIIEKFKNYDKEMLFVFYLNNRSRVNLARIEFIGTIDKQLISSRDIIKMALVNNATQVIIAHNHPSGEVEPSEQDNRATKKIMEALNMVNCDLSDHIIIGRNGYFSYKKEGKIA